MEKNKNEGLKVVLFPWLAMGHLIPFFNLSKHLALQGHIVTFVSTPKNILRLPKIPPRLTSLLTFVSLPLPETPKLPSGAECSSDVPYRTQPHLKRAFDLLEPSLVSLLEASSPDWVVYDYASHWLPSRAAALGISGAFFSLFTAACLDIIGPPSILLAGGDRRSSPEDFTVVPEWVTLETDLAFRLHEVTKHTAAVEEASNGGDDPGVSDSVRFGMTVAGSDVVAVRSCRDFEPEWFDLLGELYRKPIFPAGFLPPAIEDEENDAVWTGIRNWLDERRGKSVIYIALGTEASLTRGELGELALGLERSELPFLWALRDSPEWDRAAAEMLPDGFVDRVSDRGAVHVGWVPQVRILSHDSVGGFLTHCGWNSVIEGLGFGRPLVLLPLLNEQGLNSRLFAGKGLGVEIPRDERDGWFTADSVADSVRFAAVDRSGESVRVRACEMRGFFGDAEGNDRCLGEFMRFLVESRRTRLGT